MLRTIVISALCFCQLFGFSQSKTINAVKTTEVFLIDGNLDEPAWQQAAVADDFIQSFPSFGIPASVRSQVRILYDNDAVYVGAYLYDDPSLLRTQLTARDGEQRQDVDYFSVFFDTYNDQQNAFQFLVTTANVQSDARIGGGGNLGFGDFGDKSWNAVWQSNVQMKSDGWVVEMRIPYISLRFSKKEVQTWGLQLLRFTRRNNESSYWNPVNPNENGFTNQFGKMEELRNIEPPLRLSFSPYVSTGVRINPEGSDIKSQWLRNGGMDVKYGINESFTLDVTLIPDFGQVVSDNIINNLSPFEVQFQENRPFFTEGTELFNKSELFYSRRIGRTPSGYFEVQDFVNNNNNYDLITNPSITQLYNGLKFSGRTKKKLGIGVFNALTAPMRARLRSHTTKEDSLIETEPLANYNIIVLDQALKGRSSITFTNTNVIRNGSARDANVSSFDLALFTPNNYYSLRATGRYSKIFGYTPYFGGEINLVYDTITRNGGLFVKPYNGFQTGIELAKVSGRLQFNIDNSITSNTYDPNDLGYLQTANVVQYNAGVSYNQLTATEKLNSYRYSLSAGTRYLYKPYRFAEVELNASAFWFFKNFWDITLSVNSFPAKQRDFFDLRTPGKFLERPSEVTFGLNGSTDSRQKWFLSFDFAISKRSVRDNQYHREQVGFRYRFSDRFLMSMDLFLQYEQNQRGYAFIREMNGDPIAGHRNFKETQSIISGIYNFNSRLNMTLRARHYWNKVRYNSFFTIGDNGEYFPRAFIPGRDENYNVFNLDAFLTWDFRLGSRIIVGWKNWLGDSFGVDGIRYNNYFGNLEKMISISHGNELTVKLIYFLDYNQLKRNNQH